MVSKRSARPRPLFLFLLFALLFSLQVLPRLTEDSPAGDESIDIVDGYYYWKGSLVSAIEHPPLVKALQALPLEAMGLESRSNFSFPQYDQRAWYFLFVLNRGHWPAVFAVSRCVSWLFGLGIGFLLYRIAREESAAYLICVLSLWAFDPSLLAFSGLAVADGPTAFFFLAAIWSFQKARKNPEALSYLKAGLLAGMAVTAKFTMGLLAPLFVILEIWAPRTKKIGSKKKISSTLRLWAWMGLAAIGWIFMVYLPGTFLMPDHRSPFCYFLNGLGVIPHLGGRPVYFQGILDEQSHWAYYPVAFGLKSTLTLLILLTFSLGLVWARKIKISVWQWIPPLFFFFVLCPFHDIGVRMLLPIYPFLFLIAARAGEWMWNNRPQGSRVSPILLAGLLGFQALSVGLSFPFQISYFNELVPQDRKIYWLGDANLDIGQDTKRLAQEGQRRGWRHVKLAYLGISNPAWYGMDWQSWTQKDLAGPQAGWVYAINAEFIQLGPAFDPDASSVLNSWILKAPPTGRVGDTWYFIEMPGKIQPDHSAKVASAPFFSHYDGGH